MTPSKNLIDIEGTKYENVFMCTFFIIIIIIIIILFYFPLPPVLLVAKPLCIIHSHNFLIHDALVTYRRNYLLTFFTPGACWAFSSTGSIEGINQIVTGSLVSLSEQELVDCDQSYNSGCGGGLMDYAFQWVIKNRGIDTENDYPYQAGDSACNKNKMTRRVVTIDSYTDVPESDEEKLRQAVAIQPVSVGLCGSERSFQLYSKGIFSGPCSKSLDHAVLIVGYGSENGVDYWILKNSWGTNWGMNGYMHMQRNSGDKQGVCGINMLASYPVKTSPNPPPSPSPTKCSLLTSCGSGETCCCGRRLLGICFSWKCCGLDSAVCCKDHRSCCPHDYPICDTNEQKCYKRAGNSTMVKGLEQRESVAKFGGWRSVVEAWYL
ncbi:hypothetical protein IFM89_025945 [Coptis chinensis]|uniref:Uncharacterized protein n=1 Tax=Coptis chinensis TaxID=261450 RepID=A0A835HMQ1_9MAGN|nr:hypothetical protein IFM89_025945 [Coptis chinensis]